MTKKAEGVVEKAGLYKGRARAISYIRINVCNIFGPQKSKPFKLKIGNETIEGKTTERGEIEITVPKSADEAILDIEEQTYNLKLIDNQPLDSIEWTQRRLIHLGFECGTIDGQWGQRSRTAMMLFQKLHGLKPTGFRDKQSLDLLEKLHDQRTEDVEQPIEQPEESSDKLPDEETA